MLVIVDTSPLNYLVWIGAIEILPQLYGKVMASFLFTTPAFMLSGFAFPTRNMPMPVQYPTYLNPVRYFIEIVRGIFLKGVGAEVLWPQMACLAVYGVTVLGLSAMRFSKKLD